MLAKELKTGQDFYICYNGKPDESIKLVKLKLFDFKTSAADCMSLKSERMILALIKYSFSVKQIHPDCEVQLHKKGVNRV